jgi:cytochrome d ubiquinol oxidase subunit I
MLFVGLGFFALAALKRGYVLTKWVLRAIVVTLPLGFVAIETGWFVTEFGRQPWIVWQIMRVEDAATPQDGVVLLLVVFSCVYLALTAALILLLLLPDILRRRLPRLRGWNAA